MPIERKDRSFDKIFDEVTLEKIPMDYIKSVRIMLSDGSQIDMSKSELENLNSEHDILRRFKMTASDASFDTPLKKTLVLM